VNIRQRIIFLVLVAFVALGFVGGFAVFQARSGAIDVKSVTEGVVPSSAKAISLMTQLKDVQITALGMVSAVDNASVEEGHKALSQRKSELQGALEAQSASADNEAQRGLVRFALDDMKNYFAAIDETAKFKLEGQQELAEVTLAANVDQYLRTLGEAMTALQVEKTRSRDTAIASLNAKLEDTQTTLTMVSVGAALGLGLLGFLLYRQVVLPIGAMENKMTAIATSQDFSQRLPVKRMDEVGRSVVAFNKMIEKIQESAEQVRQKTADIHAMLHSIPQGILTIEAGGRIHPEYSEQLKSILEADGFAGQNVNAVLFESSGLGADALSQADASIAACIGEDEMNFEFNSHLLPTEIEKTLPSGAVKVLDLHWAPMTDGAGNVTRLLLCLRDVTELRALARAAEAGRRELALIGEILAVPQEKFQTFIDGAVQFVEQNASLISQGAAAADDASRSDVVGLLFRNMHTVKGNARTHGLLQLADVVHRIEETYDALRKDTAEWDTERLNTELNEARVVVTEYDTLNQEKLGRSGPGRRGSVDKFFMVAREQVQRLIQTLDQADLHDGKSLQNAVIEARQTVKRIGTERIEDALSGVLNSLPPLARELGKVQPVVTINDNGVVVRSQVAGLLRNTYMHLLRNALDHGIETPEVRQAAGKAAAGHLTLSAALDVAGLRLVLQDDGRGLNLKRIRDKAEAAGLVSAGESLSPQSVASLIFRPGFSTAEQVTEVSGRGVGLDAVKAFVESEGGQVALELQDGENAEGFVTFRTVVTLPAELAVRLVETHQTAVSHV
jgi:two-component system chemotaxis sensor kinase CheA